MEKKNDRFLEGCSISLWNCIEWIANPNPSKWNRLDKINLESKIVYYSIVVILVSLILPLAKSSFTGIPREILEDIESIAIVSAALVFLLESKERQKNDRKIGQYEAWRVINSSQGQAGSGGRILALQDLNKEAVSLEGIAAPNADLSGIDLSYANLARADFTGATLKGANLKGANMTSVNLEGAILEDAILDLAILDNANISCANLSFSSLKEASLANATAINTNLSNARMEKASLYGAILFQANLRRANLESSCLRYSNFEGASLEGANLKEADLKGIKLNGAIFRNQKKEKVLIKSPSPSLIFKLIDLTVELEDPTILNDAVNLPKYIEEQLRSNLGD